MQPDQSPCLQTVNFPPVQPTKRAGSAWSKERWRRNSISAVVAQNVRGETRRFRFIWFLSVSFHSPHSRTNKTTTHCKTKLKPEMQSKNVLTKMLLKPAIYPLTEWRTPPRPKDGVISRWEQRLNWFIYGLLIHTWLVSVALSVLCISISPSRLVKREKRAGHRRSCCCHWFSFCCRRFFWLSPGLGSKGLPFWHHPSLPPT